MRSTRARTTVAAITGLILLGSSFPAPPAVAAAANEVHCVQRAQGLGAEVVPPPHCFSSYAAVVAYLTGGRVRVPTTTQALLDGSGTTALDQAIRVGEIANTTHVLSTEYTDAGYAGSSYTFTWTSDCTGINVAWSSMPAAFNDDLSSSHTGPACTAIHYDSAGAAPSTPPAGSSISCPAYGSCSTLTTMNDRTSSMRWVP